MREAEGCRHHPTTLTGKAGAYCLGLQPLGDFGLRAVCFMGAVLCGALLYSDAIQTVLQTWGL